MTENLKELAAEMKRRGIPPRYFAAQLRRGLSAEQIMAAWPVPAHLDQVGKRRSRRRLVVAVYGGWVLVAILSKVLTPLDSILPVIPVVPLASALGALILLSRRTFLNREVLAGDSGLDERLVQNRNRAFRAAYQIFGPVALIAWPVTVVTLQTQPANAAAATAFVIYSGAALLGTTLPAAIWAWREPDPVDPEPLTA
ncbi:MAG TPA: hypothetical protein VF990_15165 [Candidatus Dormibacteraeota bacterium]